MEKKMETGSERIAEALEHNRRFVQEKEYEKYITDKYPKKKLAILTCMDTRLTELLPAALGLQNGDAKIIRNAGGVIRDPYGSEIKSLLVAILELGVSTVMVIGHTDCGVEKINSAGMLEKLKEQKVSREVIEELTGEGIDFDGWLSGIRSAEEGVRSTVALLKNHPLIPEDICIAGFVMETRTGEMIGVSGQ